MYAVVTAGGRQYRVSPGDTLDVEKLTGAVGDTVALTNVQLVGQGAEVTVGAPAVAGVRVEAQIMAQKRGKKNYYLQASAAQRLSPQTGASAIADFTEGYGYLYRRAAHRA
jgi:large subunit ribosomal protein L21